MHQERTEKASGRCLCRYYFKDYAAFLHLAIPTSPSRPELNSHAAAGMGTADSWTWPLISPPEKVVVWILMCHKPASRSADCAPEIVVDSMEGLVVLLKVDHKRSTHNIRLLHTHQPVLVWVANVAFHPDGDGRAGRFALPGQHHLAGTGRGCKPASLRTACWSRHDAGHGSEAWSVWKSRGVNRWQGAVSPCTPAYLPMSPATRVPGS